MRAGGGPGGKGHQASGEDIDFDGTLSASDKEWVSQLLSSPAGREVQDAQARSDVTGYIEKAMSLGIQDPNALCYYADIVHQVGTGAIKKYHVLAAEKAGGYENVTLEHLYQAALNYATYTKARRTKVYNLLKAGPISGSGGQQDQENQESQQDQKPTRPAHQPRLCADSHRGSDLDPVGGFSARRELPGGKVEQQQQEGSHREGRGGDGGKGWQSLYSGPERKRTEPPHRGDGKGAGGGIAVPVRRSRHEKGEKPNPGPHPLPPGQHRQGEVEKQQQKGG